MQWISSSLLTGILLVMLGVPCYPDYFSSQKNYLDSRLETAAKQQEAAVKNSAKATANYRYDVRIDVIGMTTKEAARHIYDRFKVEKRIKQLNIDVYRQRLYIMLQPNQPITDKDLKGLVTSAGYGVRRIFRKSNHYDMYKKELQRIKKSNSRLLPNPSFDPE